MKKLFALILCLCLGLSACGNPGVSNAGENAAGDAAEGSEITGDTENTPIANVPAPTAEEFRDLFLACTGYQGSAGASLRNVLAACQVIQFAVDHHLGSVDEEELRTALLDGYTQMDDDARAEFHLNFAASITPLAEDAFSAWSSVKDEYESAGMEEAIQELVQKPGAFEDWNALRSYVFIMGNEMS